MASDIQSECQLLDTAEPGVALQYPASTPAPYSLVNLTNIMPAPICGEPDVTYNPINDIYCAFTKKKKEKKKKRKKKRKKKERKKEKENGKKRKKE